MVRRLRLPSGFVIALFALSCSALPARAQMGVALTGAGAVNRSMGGASVAAPIDPSGSLYWNPAAISGLGPLEMDFSTELLYPQGRLSSSVAASALRPGIPPLTLSGATRSDSGVAPLPAVGLVYRPEESLWTYGVGFFVAGGFTVNYPGSLTNPILTPQPPKGLGAGPVEAEFELFQLVPTVSYQVNKNLAIGFAPTVNLAHLSVDPFFNAPPDDANGDGLPTYESATHTRVYWGLGFQTGVYYTTDSCWNFGVSVKSPQWFEPFRYHATDELGRPRTLKLHFDYPMIASLGTSYTGFERWLLAADFRLVNYHNTPPFSHSGFDAEGTLRGVGWKDIFALSLGAQYQLTDTVSLRLGYSYNDNPIADDKSAFNIASPTIVQHTVYVGGSYNVSKCLKLSLAYVHGFENSIEGPFQLPTGTVARTRIKSEVSGDALVVGASVKF